MSDPRPWFAFHHRDFWSSPSVRLMSIEAAGLYIALLSDQWDSGRPICSDPAVWKATYGHRCLDWEQSWAAVRKCFEDTEPGYMQNVRLEVERSVANSKNEERSKKARESAERRWELERARREALKSALPDSADAVALPSHAIAMRIDAFDATGQDSTGEESTDPPRPPLPGGKPKRASRSAQPGDPGYERGLYWSPPWDKHGLPGTSLLPLWSQLCANKKRKRAGPMLDASVVLMLERLAGLGPELAVQRMEQAVVGGYQSPVLDKPGARRELFEDQRRQETRERDAREDAARREAAQRDREDRERREEQIARERAAKEAAKNGAHGVDA